VFCERFGWTEAEYKATSRRTIAEFTTILNALEAMAEEEREKAEKEAKRRL
jgi:hypothetical protein